MSRRAASAAFPGTVLACCLLLLAALCGGCAQHGPRTLVVLGPWTNDEGKAFEATLRHLDDHTGYRYTYQGTTSLSETLAAEIEAGSPPDVAVLNSIGELTSYAGQDRIRPLDTATAKGAGAPWAPELTVNGARHTYWVPLKVDVKSLVWSRKDASAGARPWCVGLASQATSGWPGTDWIEDILLHQSGPRVYEQWATGQVDWTAPPVLKAWQTWGSILDGFSDKVIAEDLRTPYGGPPGGGDGPARGLLASPDCRREHQIGFIRSYYTARDSVDVGPSAPYLHGLPRYADDFEVSSDMAAVFTDNPAAQELVRSLTSPEGRGTWQAQARDLRDPGLQPLFPGPGAPMPSDRLGRKIAPYLTGGGQLCFDASDVMPPVLRDSFYRAVLEFFRDHSADRLHGLLQQLQTVASTNEQKDEDTSAATDPARYVCAAPPA